MKRNICVLIFAAFMLMLAGCGFNQKTDNGSGSGATSVKTEAVPSTASLDVENDQFTFDELSQQIGAKETDVIEFLGAKEKSETYSTKLFGETVEISLDAEEDVVGTIQMVFPDTDQELLKNAISEQLGQDGKSDNEKTEWKDESGVTTLSLGEDGCMVKITK